MAFGRLERPRPSTPMSDINMTPLIDVMLVLLVIFMVTAPLMSSSLRLDLPKADGAKPLEAAAVLAVGLDREGRLFIGEQRSSLDELRQKAKEAAEKNPATEVHLRADSTAPYGKVAELIGLLQQAGLTRIGFVAEAKAP
ncbi:ExbD/TolR family protein [Ideonella paludis]|uniref:Biopolymer transporter ExbD n=2 Tax=Ideonella paludis TaxID=1233411 RepID=A0ABS5DS69_9BURK|nr:biopolymer transporter ExbD [Ideonella paludis]MBQ0934003.1 biopolymer transporter ExbD [Ideonella paludis]